MSSGPAFQTSLWRRRCNLAGEDVLIGLMSGTSTDGVDAAAVRIAGAAHIPRIELLAFVTVPYRDADRAELLRCASGEITVAELARLNFTLGGLMADAAVTVMQAAGLGAAEVLAIGSHGHTVAHLPPRTGNDAVSATLQIGEAAVIAERTSIQVVCDFRVRDVAAGGQGAPLVPHFDYAFLRSDSINRAALNIGGIANVTLLPAGAAEGQVRAFDIGPGNMPLDAAMRLLVPDGPGYDENGQVAAAGTVCLEMVDWVLGHEFFAQPLPRSCGREEFGEHFVTKALAQFPGLHVEDVLASITEACGRAIGEAIAGVQGTTQSPWEVIASGGGVHNTTLMDAVARHAAVTIRLSDAFGIPSDAKEAMAFAFLARECLLGLPGNVPAATGAAGPRVLGKIVPA
ncbi:MAG: anhydro-N-acetylmuramic acid kinase [Armatimonadetes bacterium]|nr:anhydro-N-acetylmuramic acid kinase [Armatimonadota bacterium]